MKKTIVLRIVTSALMITFAAFIVGWNIFASSISWSSKSQCLADNSGWSNIPAITGFVCDLMPTSTNTCAAWIASTDDPSTSDIEIQEDQIVVSGETRTVTLGLFGMCTDSGAVADELYIVDISRVPINGSGLTQYAHARGASGYSKSEIGIPESTTGITLPGSFMRQSWTTSPSGLSVHGNVVVDIDTFDNWATKVEDTDTTTYTATVWLNRCYAGSTNIYACDIREANFTLTIPNNMTYAAQSQIWAEAGTANTEAQTSDKTETVDATGEEISTEDEVDVRFSHNALASAAGDYEGSGFTVEMEIKRDGNSLGSDGGEDVEKTEKNQFVLSTISKFADEKYDSTYHYAEGASNYDAGESVKFVSTKLYTFKFKKPGEYEICEKITFEEITTGVCIKYKVEGVDYFASSAVVVKDCDAEKATSDDCFGDDQAETSIVDESPSEPATVDSTGTPLAFKDSEDDEEYTYTLTFVHNVYAGSEMDSGGGNKYSLEKSGDFEDDFVTAELKSGESTEEAVSDKSIDDYKTEFDSPFHIPSSPAKDYDGKKYTIVHVYDMTIKGKNGDDFILGEDEDSKELEFCEEITHQIDDGDDIKTKACHKIKIKRAEVEADTGAVIEDTVKLTSSTSGVDVTTPEAFSGLAWKDKPDVTASPDAEATIEIDVGNTATVELEFKYGVYGMSNEKTWDSSEDIPYSISEEGNGWSNATVTDGPQQNVDSKVSGSSLNREGKFILGTGGDIAANKDKSTDCPNTDNCRYLFATTSVSGDNLRNKVALGISQAYTVELSDEDRDYTFCKVIQSGTLKAKVCVKIKVKRNTTPPATDCPTYYEDGKTHVFSGIRTEGVKSQLYMANTGKASSRYTPASDDDWFGTVDGGTKAGVGTPQDKDRDIIYVRPGEKVHWIGCYYPGAQAYADEEVHTINGVYEDPENLERRDHVGCNQDCYAETKALKDTNQLEDPNEWRSDFAAETDAGPDSEGKHWYEPYEAGKDKPKICFTSKDDRPDCYDLEVGNTDVEQTRNRREIAVDDVGKSYFDQLHTDGNPVTSNVTGSSFTCYHQVTCNCTIFGCSCCDRTKAFSFEAGTFTTGERNSTTEVRVPYNYKNSAEIKIKGVKPTEADGPDAQAQDPNKEVVYAGDMVTVETAKASVGMQTNDAVGGSDYATKIPHGSLRMIFYVATSNQDTANAKAVEGSPSDYSQDVACSEILTKGSGEFQYKGGIGENGDFCKEVARRDFVGDEMNPSGNENGTEYYVTGDSWVENSPTTNIQYNVFDANAGDWFCAVTAIYPYITEHDQKYLESASHGERDGARIGSESWAGSKEWWVSSPSCIQIAKKPSFEVWGGSVFTEDSIEANVARKSNLYGLWDNGYGYSPFPYTRDNGSFYGSWVEESVLAKGTTTKFASGAAIGLNGATGDSRRAGIKDNNGEGSNYCEWTPLTIANVDCASGTAGNAGNIDSKTTNLRALVDFWKNTMTTIGGRTVKVDRSNTATGYPSFAKSNTYIYDVSGDFTIDYDIKYTTDGLSAAAQIPKMIVYATGDIKISCYVNRVDAILITDGGTVDTCYEASDSNSDLDSSLRSNQLAVNGMVIADSIKLKRTYGAAMGNYSGEPAEIINYDTSAILWGSFMSSAADSSTLVTTYQEELAPRY